MGYFPLPELKGKPNRIFVDGKTLNQIAKESGIRLDTVQHRYSRGIRDYEGLTKPSYQSRARKDTEENLLYNECWRESNGEDLGAGYTSPDYLR